MSRDETDYTKEIEDHEKKRLIVSILVCNREIPGYIQGSSRLFISMRIPSPGRYFLAHTSCGLFMHRSLYYQRSNNYFKSYRIDFHYTQVHNFATLAMQLNATSCPHFLPGQRA